MYFVLFGEVVEFVCCFVVVFWMKFIICKKDGVIVRVMVLFVFILICWCLVKFIFLYYDCFIK